MTPSGGRGRDSEEERATQADHALNGPRTDRRGPGNQSADGAPGARPVGAEAASDEIRPSAPERSRVARGDRPGSLDPPSHLHEAPPRRGDAIDGSRQPAIDLIVSVVVLTIRSGHLAVLLAEGGEVGPRGEATWTLPGGPVATSEDLDAAARRHLEAAIGSAGARAHLEQLRTWSPPAGEDPGPAGGAAAGHRVAHRLVRVGYLALLAPAPTGRAATGLIACRFWPVGDLATAEAPARPAGDDHVIAEGVERARAKLEYTPLATAFVEEPFTLADLRRIYEAVWGQPVQPANFRRRVLSIEGFVVPLGRATATHPAGSRPADLYGRGPARLLHPALLRPSIAKEAEVESDDDL